ncbi:MAG TPA: efflux transporter outer membrane subunit [Hyphomicrobium sp.]|nr:efflux transporter outer membrane subunit [Hyphomicrobium sp.]
MQYAANYERVAVAKENLGDAERVLKIIKQRQAAGTAAELDTAQQESLVATQRAAIPALRLTAETSRTALALLLGRPPQGFELNTKTTRSLRFPDVLPGLPSSLLFRRPDVRAAEQQLEAQDADVQVARKAFLPTIQLTGDAGFQSAALATLLRPESFIWSIAAGVTQPIFEGGRLVEQLALSEAQRQQLLETYRKSIIQALTDVENALIGIRENSAREVAQRQVVSAARQALDLTKQRLDAGTIDTTTLLNAQIALFQAQDSLVQVRLARLQAIVSLFQALGGDWSEG